MIAAKDWSLLWFVSYSRCVLFFMLHALSRHRIPKLSLHRRTLLEPAGVLLIGIRHTQHRRFIKGLTGNLQPNGQASSSKPTRYRDGWHTRHIVRARETRPSCCRHTIHSGKGRSRTGHSRRDNHVHLLEHGSKLTLQDVPYALRLYIVSRTHQATHTEPGADHITELF